MANKPYNPFNNGVQLIELDWLDVRLQVAGDKDNFVLYGRTRDGEAIVLNIVGDDVYDED